MQPKAPTFGLGAHGFTSNVVGRPGAQYITDHSQRLQMHDGPKSYRHGHANNATSYNTQPSDPTISNDPTNRYQTHHQASQNSNSFKGSTGNGSGAPNHRKNSKSSYQIIQNSLSKTKSVKTVGTSNKIQQNMPSGSNNRQSVPFLHTVQAQQQP